jgi:long-chain acyl-CoA synthetase
MNMNYIPTIIEKAFKIKGKNAMGYYNQEEKNWSYYSWEDLGIITSKTARSLLSLGIQKQENVCIFSQNMPEWTFVDLGTILSGGVCVPIYATNTADQAEYIIQETEARFLFVGEEDQYKKAIKIYENTGTKLEKIIVFDEQLDLANKASVHFSEFLQWGESIPESELDQIIKKISDTDLATIIYTSGTTGIPKGVMLSHGNFNHAFKIHDQRLKIEGDDHSLAFLPLSHIFERAWTMYALYKGVKVTYLKDPKLVSQALSEIKPTVMCSVPRLYQKAFHAIQTKIKQSSRFKKRLFDKAIKTGQIINEYKRKGQKPPFILWSLHLLYDKLVFGKIRRAFGGRLRFMPCAGAPLLPCRQKLRSFFIS